MQTPGELDKQSLRLLKLLAKQVSKGFALQNSGKKATIEYRARKHSFDAALIVRLNRSLQVSLIGNRIYITISGLESLKRCLNADVLMENPERVIAKKTINFEGEIVTANLNLNESPLLRLFSRTTTKGKAYFTSDEFLAGEQLRKDFECGLLQPRVSSVWGETGTGGRSNAKSELSDFAIDSRNRVYRALQKLGPDLSGVAVDICCFLKGLEKVEKERQWPARSAKLMLKTALSMLARHYGMVGHENKQSKGIVSWGDETYRSNLTF